MQAPLISHRIRGREGSGRGIKKLGGVRGAGSEAVAATGKENLTTGEQSARVAHAHYGHIASRSERLGRGIVNLGRL